MNEWLVAALVLIGAIAPLGVVCVRGSVAEAVVAVELAGMATTLVLLLLAEGFQREVLADIAIALAVVSFAGNVAYARFLEREPAALEAPTRGG